MIGALATYTEIIRSPLVRRRLPMLAEAAREVGSPQIQNRGTLGGNVANASPAGDTLPVLAVAEAVVVLRSVGRRAPRAVRRLLHGLPADGACAPTSSIVAIEVPPVDGRQWFRKVGTRAAQAISKVVMAGGARARGPASRSAASRPPSSAHRARRRASRSAARSTEAQAVLADEIPPIDDVRSTAAYRRRVAANLLAQFWSETGRRGRR